MKLTRVEKRCPCGCLLGTGLCEIHDQRKRNENKVTRKELFVPGLVVGGATLIEKLEGDRFQMRCNCGMPFITTKSALLKVRNRKKRSLCGDCLVAARQQKQEVA